MLLLLIVDAMVRVHSTQGLRRHVVLWSMTSPCNVMFWSVMSWSVMLWSVITTWSDHVTICCLNFSFQIILVTCLKGHESQALNGPLYLVFEKYILTQSIQNLEKGIGIHSQKLLNNLSNVFCSCTKCDSCDCLFFLTFMNI